MNKKLILTGRDLIKGATLNKGFNNSILYDAMPWQMVPLDEKTQEWKEWNADFFELIGLKEVESKRKRIIKNRMMASGILDMNDYSINGNNGLNSFLIQEESPLKKFYPLIPPFINVLHGEFIKRDNRVFVKCIDRETEDEKLQYKMELVNQIIVQDALKKKQRALESMGITQIPEEQIATLPQEQQSQASEMNNKFMEEMQVAQELAESEQKYKKYRHIMEELGQIVLNKDMERFDTSQLEVDSFLESVTNSEIAWHLDMRESDYRVEIIDNAMSFSHQSPNIKYYSSGDYFGWFEFMSVGDIINRVGDRLTDKQFSVLKESIHNYTDNEWAGVGIIPDQFRNQQGAFYDATKPYPKGRTDLNKYTYVQNEVVKDFISNTSLTSDQFALLHQNQTMFSQKTPKMFRMMRVYFRSQRRIGWLTKKDRSGIVNFQGWVDENFKTTVDPIYDLSETKEKDAESLVYGEHIDWTWTNEWRHIIKINLNNDHPYWKERVGSTFDPIYIDGDPIKYNFSGKSDDPYEVHPPFEGIQWKMQGVRPVSPVELLEPFQILTNIAYNKIPEIMFDDVGLALAINENTTPNNLPGIEAGGDPLEIAMENLKINKVFSYKMDREILKQQGNSVPITPQILNLSRIQEGIQYLGLAMQLKEAAGEIIGISRQRMAQSKASETATQTQQGINYSEVQTEYLFNRFSSEFMPRIYQKMIEAALYYMTISGEVRAFYQTSTEGNALLQVENSEGTFRKYSVKAVYNSRERETKQKLEQLFLNNNTTEVSMFDLATGIADTNVASIMENLRKAKVHKEQEADKQYQQQMEMQQQAEQAAKKRQQAEFDHEENLQRIRNEGNERAAMIRALGGLQSDNNQNGELDAFENLKLQITQMQNNFQNTLNQDNLDFNKKKHQDDIDYKHRQLISKEAIEQKKLAIALANVQKNDDKNLNKSIAKKQGIS